MQETAQKIREEQASQTKALFGFARELGRVRRENITRLDRHPWHIRMSEIDASLPGVKKWTPESRTPNVLLRVEQQDLPACPGLPEELRPFVAEGWDRPEWEAPADVPGGDPKLARSWSAWLERRRSWLLNWDRCSRSLELFQNLYAQCRFIEDGNLRFVAKAGSISFASDEAHGAACHPVLSRPVLFRLSVEQGRAVITVQINESEPVRFESELLSDFQDDGFRLELCQGVRGSVDSASPHPFAPGPVRASFQNLAATISPECRWADAPQDIRFNEWCHFAFYEEPVLWIEERASGMAEASERIIRRINEGAEIPRHLIDLICGAAEKEEQGEAPGQKRESLEQRLASAGGEDEDILLTMPANREQLQVAREIRSRDAVLVMGPPGTGKTHTIANLISDFLAQGQTVLISSQKEKALRVLKSMMPAPLQDLCVSISSDQDDVLSTVQRLTDRLALVRIEELGRRIEAEEASRRATFEELGKTRNALYGELCREFRTVRLCGRDWTPSSLGRWLKEHSDLAEAIPDPELPEGPFPLSSEEARELGQLMKLAPGSGSPELLSGLPALSSLPDPVELAHLQAELQDLKAFIAKSGISIESLDGEDGALRYRLGELSVVARHPQGEPMASLSEWLNRDRTIGEPEGWVMAARAAGAAGGALEGRWKKLGEAITSAAALAEKEMAQMDDLPVGIREGTDRAALREALSYFRDNHINGEPGFLTKLTQKTRLAALACSSVGGHMPSSEHEYEAVLLRLNLEEARESLRKLWDDLITGAGGPAFDALGADHPEEQAKLRFAPKLEKALGWWSEWAQPLLERLRGLGVNPDALTGGTGAGPIESCEALTRNVESFIRPAAEADHARARMVLLGRRLAQARQALLQCARGNPQSDALCDELLAGLEESGERYEKAWKQLSELNRLQPRLERRKELLSRLMGSAPQWTREMFSAGGGGVPDNAAQAWDWRQLDAWFRKYLETDYGDLQKKAESLSSRLRAETVQLAADKAWLALARRMQGNRSLMQKLQGWAQIAARIGRGTSRSAEVLRAQARELIAECSQAIPCWIMPAEKALSTFDGSWKFDVVIIDEASQSDIASMPILFLAKKAIIAGDDRQVSPAAVGVGDSAVLALLRQYIQGRIANWPIYQAQSSLYDLAKTAYSPLMLREHFRCVPPIIGYSNELSYDGCILPLRDAASTSLLPAIVSCRVQGVRESNDTNRAEAEAIVGRIKACLAEPLYRDKTFGVIVMRSGRTGAQIQLINDLLYKALGPETIERHKILCGLSPDFQGDERDVIFLSLVDSPDGSKPLRKETAGSDDGMKKRWNVAVSRARDQIWAVYSFDPETQLQDGDIRKTFFDYLKKPDLGAAASGSAEMPEFAAEVASALESRRYRVLRGYRVGAFQLPLVVEGSGRKAVLECDGDLAHPDEERVMEELERQAILERVGWKFVRVRGGEWYRDPESALWWLVSDLEELGVKASDNADNADDAQKRNPELMKHIEASAGSYAKVLRRDVSLVAASRAKRERIIAELRKLGAEVDLEVRKGSARS